MNLPDKLSQHLEQIACIRPDAEATRTAVVTARQSVLAADAPVARNQVAVFLEYFVRVVALRVAASLLVAGAVLGFVISSLGPSVAFADVVDQISQLKTVQYAETRTGRSSDGKLRSPTEIARYTVLGRSRQRQEVTAVIPGDPLPDGQEWSHAAIGVATVSDLASGKIVRLDTNRKVFSEVKAFMSLEEDGSITKHDVKPAPEVDFYRNLRAVPIDDAERLPAKTIEGKKVIGFRTTETLDRQRGVDTWSRTYWVDPVSKLPVQIEVTSESTVPGFGSSRWVLSDLVFDEPIDEGLLSTDPPKGYTVR